MPPKARTEAAYQGALHRTIPKKFADVAVTTANGVIDLTPYGGKWVYLRALTANVSIRLGTGNTLTLSTDGYPILVTDSRPEEFFIDPGDDLVLNTIGASAGTLRIFYD